LAEDAGKSLGFTVIVLLLSIICSMGITCAASAKRDEAKQEAPEFETGRVPGEYIIKVAEGVDEKALYRLFSTYIVVSVRKIHSNLYLIGLEHDPGPTVLRDEYLENDDILHIQPNYTYREDGPGDRQAVAE
jgi:hypothetical protein